MSDNNSWQLPDGVDEVLPKRAFVLESLRRELLDLYHSCGYQLVEPPLVEFTESLLVGLGADLDLLTCKIPDQLSGRMMGVRADLTPQVARMDAHSMSDSGINRLCYSGPVLHAKPKSAGCSRSPIQVGAEIFGESSVQADIEIIDLMLETVELSGLSCSRDGLTLDLGHVGVVQNLLKSAELEKKVETKVVDALKRKSIPDLERVLESLDESFAKIFLALARLNGDASVLLNARELVLEVAPAAVDSIDLLSEVIDSMRIRRPGINIYVDLAELRGYNYHTGIVFAAYTPNFGQAIANGGRYDNVGSIFGRSRSATGFGADLKVLMQFYSSSVNEEDGSKVISAPYSDDPGLRKVIAALRKKGERVVIRLPGDKKNGRLNRYLINSNNDWIVQQK